MGFLAAANGAHRIARRACRPHQVLRLRRGKGFVVDCDCLMGTQIGAEMATRAVLPMAQLRGKVNRSTGPGGRDEGRLRCCTDSAVTLDPPPD